MTFSHWTCALLLVIPLAIGCDAEVQMQPETDQNETQMPGEPAWDADPAEPADPGQDDGLLPPDSSTLDPVPESPDAPEEGTAPPADPVPDSE